MVHFVKKKLIIQILYINYHWLINNWLIGEDLCHVSADGSHKARVIRFGKVMIGKDIWTPAIKFVSKALHFFIKYVMTEILIIGPSNFDMF